MFFPLVCGWLDDIQRSRWKFFFLCCGSRFALHCSQTPEVYCPPFHFSFAVIFHLTLTCDFDNLGLLWNFFDNCDSANARYSVSSQRTSTSPTYLSISLLPRDFRAALAFSAKLSATSTTALEQERSGFVASPFTLSLESTCETSGTL